jgi:hypothetical protein
MTLILMIESWKVLESCHVQIEDFQHSEIIARFSIAIKSIARMQLKW